ncbi:MAG: alpha/beta hydrolase [Methyloligellaceae bacterium]
MELLPWIVAVYLLLCAGAYFGNRWFMYFPDPARYTPAEAGLSGTEEVELKTDDGQTLVAWYSKAKDGKPTILYFHGNAGNAAGRAPKIETMRGDGSGVFYLNNRGYGGSSAHPTEVANVADAFLAYDYLRRLGLPADKIVLYGESLGSGQATQLAAGKDIRAVILEAPLTSTVDVGKRTYFFLPLRYLMTDQYRNIDHIRNVHAPLLVLHGEQDAVIPVAMGKAIYDAGNEPKKLELLPEGGHNDLFEHGAWEKARSFLDNLKL